MDDLVQLGNHVKTGMANKEQTISVFFNIKKAYDITWRHGILLDLHSAELRRRLPSFIAQFLRSVLPAQSQRPPLGYTIYMLSKMGYRKAASSP